MVTYDSDLLARTRLHWSLDNPTAGPAAISTPCWTMFQDSCASLPPWAGHATWSKFSSGANTADGHQWSPVH